MSKDRETDFTEMMNSGQQIITPLNDHSLGTIMQLSTEKVNRSQFPAEYFEEFNGSTTLESSEDLNATHFTTEDNHNVYYFYKVSTIIWACTIIR